MKRKEKGSSRPAEEVLSRREALKAGALATTGAALLPLTSASHIRIFAGNAPEGVGRETVITWVAEGIKEALAYAEKRGIVLGLENHGDVTSQVDTLLAICDAVGDRPWFGVNLDTGNFLSDPYESLAKAAPWAVNVQLKARVTQDGGEVPTDLERIKQILVEADYKGWIALEYELEDPRKGVPQYVAELNELLGRVAAAHALD